MFPCIDAEKAKQTLFTYRYMWTLKPDGDAVVDKVNIKVVTDVIDGLLKFEDSVVAFYGDKLSVFCREYVCEYSVPLLGVVDSLIPLVENQK